MQFLVDSSDVIVLGEAVVGCVSDDLTPCRSLLLIQIKCKLQLARKQSTNQLSMEWKKPSGLSF